MTWSGRRLMSYAKGANSISYTYDCDGLRTQKTVNGVTTDYYYVAGVLMYEKVSGSHELFYRYDNDGRLSMIVRKKASSSSLDYFNSDTIGTFMFMDIKTGHIFGTCFERMALMKQLYEVILETKYLEGETFIAFIDYLINNSDCISLFDEGFPKKHLFEEKMQNYLIKKVLVNFHGFSGLYYPEWVSVYRVDNTYVKKILSDYGSFKNLTNDSSLTDICFYYKKRCVCATCIHENMCSVFTSSEEEIDYLKSLSFGLVYNIQLIDESELFTVPQKN